MKLLRTCAPELLSFDLADSLVSQPPGVAAACTAGLNRVVKQVVCQPLQVAVTHKGILGQMTVKRRKIREKQKKSLPVFFFLHN